MLCCTVRASGKGFVPLVESGVCTIVRDSTLHVLSEAFFSGVSITTIHHGYCRILNLRTREAAGLHVSFEKCEICYHESRMRYGLNSCWKSYECTAAGSLSMILSLDRSDLDDYREKFSSVLGSVARYWLYYSRKMRFFTPYGPYQPPNEQSFSRCRFDSTNLESM